jgi:hypothetical protein
MVADLAGFAAYVTVDKRAVIPQGAAAVSFSAFDPLGCAG